MLYLYIISVFLYVLELGFTIFESGNSTAIFELELVSKQQSFLVLTILVLVYASILRLASAASHAQFSFELEGLVSFVEFFLSAIQNESDQGSDCYSMHC